MNVDELKQLKKELHYTNETVAELSGVPLATVQKVFAGVTRNPRYETLNAIEAVLSQKKELEMQKAKAEEERAKELAKAEEEVRAQEKAMEELLEKAQTMDSAVTEAKVEVVAAPETPSVSAEASVETSVEAPLTVEVTPTAPAAPVAMAETQEVQTTQPASIQSAPAAVQTAAPSQSLQSAPAAVQTAPAEQSPVQSPSAMVSHQVVAATGHSMVETEVYSQDDIAAIQDNRIVEMIDGCLFDVQAPSVIHQYVVGELFYAFRTAMTAHGSESFLLPFPVCIQLDNDSKTWMVPDIAITANMNGVMSHGVTGAPDLVVEVISPATRNKDMMIKPIKYARAGVREYWIVDYERKATIVYYWDRDNIPREYKFDEAIPVSIWGGQDTVDMSAISKNLESLHQHNAPMKKPGLFRTKKYISK